MWHRLWIESMVIALQTMILLGLCATVGISGSDRDVAAESGVPLGLDLYRPVPQDNPLTFGKVKLGRRLFRDRLLSRDRSTACADCHRPKLAFTDGRAKAVGVYGRQGPRSVPTLINRAWGKSFFWDGRMPTLEEQVLQPILAELEMDLTLEEAVDRLRGKRRYRKSFEAAFRREPDADGLADALAAYVRTILAGDSPFDRYAFGDREALSAEELAGLRLFRGNAGCSFCHSGPTFTDEEFHNTGVAWRDESFQDDGRAIVTKDREDRGKFKTPTLREVDRTAPYMHDGSLATLEDVVEFYSNGARPSPNLDPDIRRLNLSTKEKAQLIAFLQALGGSVREGAR